MQKNTYLETRLKPGAKLPGWMNLPDPDAATRFMRLAPMPRYLQPKRTSLPDKQRPLIKTPNTNQANASNWLEPASQDVVLNRYDPW